MKFESPEDMEMISSVFFDDSGKPKERTDFEKKRFRNYMQGLKDTLFGLYAKNEPERLKSKFNQEILETLYSNADFYSFNECQALINYLIRLEIEEGFEQSNLAAALFDLTFKDMSIDSASINSFYDLYNKHIKDYEEALKNNKEEIYKYEASLDEIFNRLNIKNYSDKESLLIEIDSLLEITNNQNLFERMSEETYQKNFSNWNPEIQEEHKSTKQAELIFLIEQGRTKLDEIEIMIQSFLPAYNEDLIDTINEILSITNEMEKKTGNKYFDKDSESLELVFYDIDYLAGLNHFYCRIKENSTEGKYLAKIFDEGLSIIRNHFERKLIALHSGNVEKEFRTIIPQIESVADNEEDSKYKEFKQLYLRLLQLRATIQSLKGLEKQDNLEEQESIKNEMKKFPYVVSKEGFIYTSSNQFEIRDYDDSFMTINPQTNERTIAYKRHLQTVKNNPNEIYACITLFQMIQSGANPEEFINQSKILQGLGLNSLDDKKNFTRNNRLNDILQYLYDLKAFTIDDRQIPFLFSNAYQNFSSIRVLDNEEHKEEFLLDKNNIEISIPAERKEIIDKSKPFGFDKRLTDIDCVKGRTNEKTLKVNAQKIGMYIQQNHSGKGKFVYSTQNILNQLSNHRTKESYLQSKSRDYQRERIKLEEALKYLQGIGFVYYWCYWNNKINEKDSQPKGIQIFDSFIFVVLDIDFKKYKTSLPERLYQINNDEIENSIKLQETRKKELEQIKNARTIIKAENVKNNKMV